jgi:hypothetical protein
MQLEIELDSDDFWAFSEVARYGRSQSSVPQNAMAILTWVTLGYLGMHLFRTGEALNFAASQWILGPGVIALLVFLTVYLPKRHEKRVFEPLPDGFTLGKRTYFFSPESIDITSEHNTAKYRWSSIIDVVDSKEHFFLFIDSTAALIIPKRVFESEADRTRFEETISEFVA